MDSNYSKNAEIFSPSSKPENGKNLYNQLVTDVISFWYLTGEIITSFNELFDLIENDLCMTAFQQNIINDNVGHSRKLEPKDQLLVLLIWLRQYPAHSFLAKLFCVSVHTVNNIIFYQLFMHILYIGRYIGTMRKVGFVHLWP